MGIIEFQERFLLLFQQTFVARPGEQQQVGTIESKPTDNLASSRGYNAFPLPRRICP